jgi:predicted choloylglycine hydrolase
MSNTITLYGINEPRPGPRWRALFDATWPAYRNWYLSDGTRPDFATCRSRLTRHLPELVPTWERLVELTGQDETAARMLTLWDPPRFLPGCSQAVLQSPEPALVRNYDYSPDLFERVVYSSAFTGRRVLGTSDCLWGLLDGMNEDGLVASLAFGGRRGSAPGFGVPLVVRYVLEVADSVSSARRALDGVPVSMTYNLTLVDAQGDAMTAFVAPGSPPLFTDAHVATNHRGYVPEDPEHAARFRSVERQRYLCDVLAGRPSACELTEMFLDSPLYSTEYARAFGTPYTAVYRPSEGAVEYRWPASSWRRTFDDPDAMFTAQLGQS